MRLRIAFVAFALLAALFLVPDSPVGVVDEAAAQSPPVEVDMTGDAFVPNNITVVIQTDVIWINQDPDVHSVTTYPGQEMDFDKDPVFPATFEGTGLNRASENFNKLGAFTYFCKYHTNMEGVVNVVSALSSVAADVQALDNEFDPEELEIEAGREVNWTNNGEVLHNVEFEDPDIGDLGDIDSGESVSHRFENGGTYRYRCKYHATDFESGMVGRVTVEGETSNTTRPTVFIHSPEDGANVTGTVQITGNATAAGENATVSAVEVDAAGSGAEDANLTATGNGSYDWTFEWDSTQAENGNATIEVQALGSEGKNSLVKSIRVIVFNEPTGNNTTSPSANSTNGESPGPGFVSVLAVASVGAAITMARSRRDD